MHSKGTFTPESVADAIYTTGILTESFISFPHDFVFDISETTFLLFSLRCKPSIYFSRDFESTVT